RSAGSRISGMGGTNAFRVPGGGSGRSSRGSFGSTRSGHFGGSVRRWIHCGGQSKGKGEDSKPRRVPPLRSQGRGSLRLRTASSFDERSGGPPTDLLERIS